MKYDIAVSILRTVVLPTALSVSFRA